MKRKLCLMWTSFFALALILLLCSIVYARTCNIIFMWDKNIEPDLAGYKLYNRNETGSYSDPNALVSIINDPNTDTYMLSNFEVIEDTYFSLTAYDDSGNESGFSNEVLLDATPPSTPINFRIDVVIDVHVQ